MLKRYWVWWHFSSNASVRILNLQHNAPWIQHLKAQTLFSCIHFGVRTSKKKKKILQRTRSATFTWMFSPAYLLEFLPLFSMNGKNWQKIQPPWWLLLTFGSIFAKPLADKKHLSKSKLKFEGNKTAIMSKSNRNYWKWSPAGAQFINCDQASALAASLHNCLVDQEYLWNVCTIAKLSATHYETRDN